jgi:hypothetical protein
MFDQLLTAIAWAVRYHYDMTRWENTWWSQADYMAFLTLGSLSDVR